MMRATPILLSLLAIAGAHEAEAASFDCSKAATRTEKQICADPVLSRLDEQLDDAYRTAQHRAESRPALRDAQRKWLSTRRDTCEDSACLRKAYLDRIGALLDER